MSGGGQDQAGKGASGAAKAMALMEQAFWPVQERIKALGLKLERRSDGSAYVPWVAYGTGAGREMRWAWRMRGAQARHGNWRRIRLSGSR